MNGDIMITLYELNKAYNEIFDEVVEEFYTKFMDELWDSKHITINWGEPDEVLVDADVTIDCDGFSATDNAYLDISEYLTLAMDKILKDVDYTELLSDFAEQFAEEYAKSKAKEETERRLVERFGTEVLIVLNETQM